MKTLLSVLLLLGAVAPASLMRTSGSSEAARGALAKSDCYSG